MFNSNRIFIEMQQSNKILSVENLKVYFDSNPQLLRLTAPFCVEGYGAMYL